MDRAEFSAAGGGAHLGLIVHVKLVPLELLEERVRILRKHVQASGQAQSSASAPASSGSLLPRAAASKLQRARPSPLRGWQLWRTWRISSSFLSGSTASFDSSGGPSSAGSSPAEQARERLGSGRQRTRLPAGRATQERMVWRGGSAERGALGGAGELVLTEPGHGLRVPELVLLRLLGLRLRAFHLGRGMPEEAATRALQAADRRAPDP